MKKNKDQIKPEVEETETDSLENNSLDQDFDIEDPVIEVEFYEDESKEDPVEVLQAELGEMTTKAEEYLDGWQRARAEFANYKKRVLRENIDIRQMARGQVIKLYLDIADDLGRALQEKPESDEGETWADGIEIIFQKLRSRLEAEGIKPMNPLGEEFDPNIHEALMKEESEEYESGQIIEVMQEGYWIGDKVLRPALVRVAA
ncbi:MAG: nucleotide exchange factor GrpE [Anaerolineales bacterium]|nr:nucleotide exchange factor GrpE [Anaerolineales bacterium]